MSAVRPTFGAVPVAAPSRVAAWLHQAPDGPCPVLHAGPEVVWLDVAGRAVGVGSASAPGLPNALRTGLAGMPPEVLSARVRTAYLDSGILHLGERALVTCRLVDVRAPRLDAAGIPKTSPAVARGTPRPRGAGLVAVPGRLDADTLPELVGGLVGRGHGLTPFGDDLLCGWLAAHRALGVATPDVDAAVRRALPRTTAVSASLLECALAGEVADLVATYLRALGTPLAAAARTSLLALGHSSGAGLACGVDLGLGALHPAAAA